MSTVSLFLVTIILLASGIIAADVKGDKRIEQTLTSYNALRLKAAKKLGISNMHELIWSTDLAEKANGMALDCKKLDEKLGKEPLKPFYFSNQPSADEQFDQKSDLYEKPYMWAMNTDIGCKFGNTCGAESVICFAGPKETHYENFQHGSPGTACDGTAKDGLCTKESSFTSTLMAFLSVLMIFVI